MERKNVTSVTRIHLLGFQTPPSIRFFVFFIYLTIYCMTVCGNLLIITLVSYSKTLHSPMYFFLSQLAVSDIILITDILPNMLHAVLVKENHLSFTKCITQFYFFAMPDISECLVLTAMSYDRYLAICRPLHYNMVMSFNFCWLIIFVCWISSVLIILNHTLMILQLNFCGSDIIDHFFCDLDPILKLSCSDTTNVQLETTLLSFLFLVIPFGIVVVSYAYIIKTIYKIPSITGRQKVFSTCSSHLTVVTIFYGTLVCVYLVPNKGQSWNVTKFLSLLYTVGTPFMNPVIYSLRNKDLKKVADKFINHCLLFLVKNNICSKNGNAH